MIMITDNHDNDRINEKYCFEHEIIITYLYRDTCIELEA